MAKKMWIPKSSPLTTMARFSTLFLFSFFFFVLSWPLWAAFCPRFCLLGCGRANRPWSARSAQFSSGRYLRPAARCKRRPPPSPACATEHIGQPGQPFLAQALREREALAVNSTISMSGEEFVFPIARPPTAETPAPIGCVVYRWNSRDPTLFALLTEENTEKTTR